MRPSRWAVFISGRGSNAQAVFDRLWQFEIVLCVSSKKTALGLGKAQRSGIPVLTLESKIDWKILNTELKKRRVDKIFLLGFMKILPPEFINEWEARIFNLHPSLLPEFKGKDAIERSYQEGAAMGVSIHEVIAEMDSGPLIQQKKILEKASAGGHSLTSEEAHFLISKTEQNLVVRAFERLNFKPAKQRRKDGR